MARERARSPLSSCLEVAVAQPRQPFADAQSGCRRDYSMLPATPRSQKAANDHTRRPRSTTPEGPSPLPWFPCLSAQLPYRPEANAKIAYECTTAARSRARNRGASRFKPPLSESVSVRAVVDGTIPFSVKTSTKVTFLQGGHARISAVSVRL